MQPATWGSPLARATSTPRWIEAIQAAQENGRTIPVVPRIDSPPSMPSRGFQVCRASAPPPRHADRHADVGRAAVALGRVRNHPAHHLARHGVDGGLAGRDRQAGLGDGPHPLPGREGDSGAGRGLGARDHEAAMGHVGVVARVLDHARLGPAGGGLGMGEREAGRLAARQGDGHGLGKGAAPQPLQRARQRRRGAGAGGPAAFEGLGVGGRARHGRIIRARARGAKRGRPDPSGTAGIGSVAPRPRRGPTGLRRIRDPSWPRAPRAVLRTGRSRTADVAHGVRDARRDARG